MHTADTMKEIKEIVKLEIFHLVQLGEEQAFVKEIIDEPILLEKNEVKISTISFKGIPPYFFAQCFKFYHKKNYHR